MIAHLLFPPTFPLCTACFAYCYARWWEKHFVKLKLKLMFICHVQWPCFYSLLSIFQKTWYKVRETDWTLPSPAWQGSHSSLKLYDCLVSSLLLTLVNILMESNLSLSNSQLVACVIKNIIINNHVC